MSVIVCDGCGDWVDTDYHPVFYCHDGTIYCEECSLERELEYPRDGEYG